VETYDVQVAGGVVIADVVLEGRSRGDRDEGGHQGEKESDPLGHGEEVYVHSCSNLIDLMFGTKASQGWACNLNITWRETVWG